jgi:acyl carrier protein
MPALEQARPTPATAAEFQERLLQYINETLPHLDRHGRTFPPISAATSLFVTGLLDSLSILHLLAAIQELTDRSIPDALVVMKHFQTVEAMTAAFWEQSSQAITQ